MPASFGSAGGYIRDRVILRGPSNRARGGEVTASAGLRGPCRDRSDGASLHRGWLSRHLSGGGSRLHGSPGGDPPWRAAGGSGRSPVRWAGTGRRHEFPSAAECPIDLDQIQCNRSARLRELVLLVDQRRLGVEHAIEIGDAPFELRDDQLDGSARLRGRWLRAGRPAAGPARNRPARLPPRGRP